MPNLKNPYSDLPTPIKTVYRKFKSCERCRLHTTKCNYVFYRGASPCNVLFIGEAPGKSEDLSGRPFVGRSGQLLDDLIKDTLETGFNFTFGITNIISCIPLGPENKIRQPTKEEAVACRERFLMTIKQSGCERIVLLGKVAKKYFKQPDNKYPYPVCELDHPAYILRKGGRTSLEYARNLCYLKDFLEDYGEKTQDL